MAFTVFFGGNLYYLALAMLSSEWDKCVENLVLLLLYAIGIALGLAIVSEFEKMIRNMKKYRWIKDDVSEK